MHFIHNPSIDKNTYFKGYWHTELNYQNNKNTTARALDTTQCSHIIKCLVVCKTAKDATRVLKYYAKV